MFCDIIKIINSVMVSKGDFKSQMDHFKSILKLNRFVSLNKEIKEISCESLRLVGA